MARRQLLSFALVLLSLAPAAAQAPRRPAPSEPPVEAQPVPDARRRSSLDDLFARLAAAKDETEAKGVAGLIERRFARSGSDTADLLMSRAGEALQDKDAALAIELLDRITQLRPDWAEAWNRRASAFFLLDDPADALADLHTALRHEPRHYEAWMAVGHIRMGSDDKRGALEAYRKALVLYPLLEPAKKMVDRLAPEIDGREL